MHVDEDFAEPAVLVFAGAQIDLVAADDRLLRVALAAVGQTPPLALPHDALDHPFDDALDDPLGDERRAGGRRFGKKFLGLLVVAQQARGQRLRQLRSIAVERGRLEAEPPGQHVGLLAILDGRRVRHVDRLRDRPQDEGLHRRHHPDVAVDRQ